MKGEYRASAVPRAGTSYHLNYCFVTVLRSRVTRVTAMRSKGILILNFFDRV